MRHNIQIDDLHWHDGMVRSVTYELGESGSAVLILSVNLFNNENSQERKQIKIRCFGAGRVNLGLSTKQLKQNLFAGNISNAYLKKDTLWVYFTDGMLEVSAQRFEAEKC